VTTKALRSSQQDGEVREVLKKYPNVVGFGRGVKITDNQLAGQDCLTVFVSQKLPKKKLSRNERLPTLFGTKNKARIIDVIEMGRLKTQQAPANYPFGDCLSDGIKNGTKSSYVRTDRGILALTCSHVVMGADRDPLTPAPIRSFDWPTRAWYNFGISEAAVFETGSGSSPLDFGYLDAALVTVQPDGVSLPAPTTPAPVFIPRNLNDILQLRGQTVTGFGIASGICAGLIQSVLVSSVQGSHFKADIVIVSMSPQGLTNDGDSGMLWKLSTGALLAQHALGRHEPTGQRSMVTIGTFVFRIQNRLQIRAFYA
jgi:hypothetical protein